MSRPTQSTPRAGALGAPPKPPINPSGHVAAPGQTPRRSAGPLPGLARTASALRSRPGPPLSPSSHSSSQSLSSPLLSLPAHLRNTAPRIPSPLGKGTPGRSTQPKQSLPVRTSKITQKHILLPEEPQTKPLPASALAHPVRSNRPPPSSSRRASIQDLTQSASGSGGLGEDERTLSEMMTKSQRQEAGLPRLTAYATAETYRLKLLQAFLKREHGVGVVRVFDDAVYAVYNLPLLPGYGASTKVRSSPTVKDESPGSISLIERMNEAEEVGYHEGFFPHQQVADESGGKTPDLTHSNEYLLSSSPPREEEEQRFELPEPVADVPPMDADGFIRDGDGEGHQGQLVDLREEPQEEGISPTTMKSQETAGSDETAKASTSPKDAVYLNDDPKDEPPSPGTHLAQQREQVMSSVEAHGRRKRKDPTGKVAEVVFFDYGVTVFFGLTEQEERDILEDTQNAGCWGRSLAEVDYEVEECHYVYDPDASYPRIYNDMFTFTSSSHLLKLSVSHAIAQSTKLSLYETVMQDSLAGTSSFPKEMATTGHLSLGRKDALKMTGRLFRLRMDVNLSSGILDTPELFWSEASLLPLYEAIRDYLEIGPRVQVLNDRLSISGDLLEIIHEYIAQNQMARITWIIIGLIIIACVVAFGEVTARVLFYKSRRRGEFLLLNAAKTALNF